MHLRRFGQGILYDARRSPGQKLHKMDGNPPTPLIGYKRWHVFIRGAVLIGEDSARWLQIDRNVGLLGKYSCDQKLKRIILTILDYSQIGLMNCEIYG